MTCVHKIGLGLLGAILVLIALAFFVVWWIGAFRIVFPSHEYESNPPEIARDFGASSRLRVLLFTKTNSFRHYDGIEGARKLFDALAAKRDWALFASENSALFDAEHLALFDVVVFANASGDMLSDAQDLAFQSWLESGGAWIGIHAAGDDSHADWAWYQDTLIGGVFTAHTLGPQTQQATVLVEDRDHPVTRDLPASFEHAEEWYSWDASARERGFEVLLSVDESTYEPFARIFGSERDLRMGDHPVVWWRCVGRGRALYTALGHWADAYANPHYARLLENGVEWAADASASSCGTR
jgi:hypothetical protein